MSGLAAVLLGGYWLFTHKYLVVAILLTALLAVPSGLCSLLMLLLSKGSRAGRK